LQLRERKLRIAIVRSVDAARMVNCVEETPAVIVLQEAAVRGNKPRRCAFAVGRRWCPYWQATHQSLCSEMMRGRWNLTRSWRQELRTISVCRTPIFRRQRKCGEAVETVPRSGTHVRAAQNEKQLVKACRGTDDFGQLLRHELNNPLTGILGNAELLLSEVRRKNDGKLPPGAQTRLETIAALAVRLRETVRRLSQEWENEPGEVEQSEMKLTALFSSCDSLVRLLRRVPRTTARSE